MSQWLLDFKARAACLNSDGLRFYNCCTRLKEPDWSQFKSLETSGCIDDGEGNTTSRIPDDKAQFWTVYARDHDGMAEAITDCLSRVEVDATAQYLASRSGLPVTA
jgi:hypothetical protein